MIPGGLTNGTIPSFDGNTTNVERLLVFGRVNYTQSGVVALGAPPAGFVWRVSGILIRTTTAWNGAGADLDFGTDGTGGDADGFWDGSVGGITSASPGFYGEAGSFPTGMGAKLYNTTEKCQVNAFVLASLSNRVIATVTPGAGATTGATWIQVFGMQLQNPDS